MDRKDYNQIGKDIRDAVQNAVNSMDFSDLNRQITASVNDALAEIQGAFDTVSSELGKASQKSGQSQKTDQMSGKGQNQSEEEIRRQAREKLRQMEEEIRRRKQAQAAQNAGAANGTARPSGTSGSAAGARPHTTYQQGRPISSAVIAKRPKGSVSHVVRTVFGSILLGVSILLALLFGTLSMAGEMVPAALATLLGLVVLPVGVGGIWLLARGAKDRARLERFRTYVSCLKNRRYVQISDLAAAVKKSEKYVRKDLEKMIAMDMFPQGHVNGDQTMFVLDDATYAEYENMRLEVERKSQFLREETKDQRQLRETVERGQMYISAIRKANDDIPGEEISEKLYRLETSVARIYTQIQKAPQKLPELRKFQEYYLPTTLKLVETYREFDGQPIAGDNIKNAKAEIEASLETIIQAFDKLFDSLFAETAMDVSTDISVLQTLLAQEGLTEDAWKKATGGRVEYMDMSDLVTELDGDGIRSAQKETPQNKAGMARATSGGTAANEQEKEPDIRLML